MDRYLVILTAPSAHLLNEEDNYIEPYEVQFEKGTSLEEIGTFIDEKLMRKFSLIHNVALNSVKILAAARIKN